MSVRTDVINLNVNINGDEARNKMNELRKSAADIKFEMEGLKKGTEEYKLKAEQLKSVKTDMEKLKESIGLTAMTQKELNQEITKLTSLRNSVTPFTEEWKKYDAQLTKVKDRHYEVKNGVEGIQVFFHKMSDEVKQLGMLAVGYLGFEFISSQFQSIIKGAGKLSDSLADIRRVTGMTAEEVNHLNSALGKVDTRTSTAGLREIAVIAGKLGVAKNDILGFVQATDKLVVALGDELGDADQITTQLGKIIGVFDKGDKKVTGEKLTLIGNAIVDLANKGVASGGFIVDFTQRLAGLAETANLTLPQVMGLAAGLEESGQRSESSSTAIIKVLAQIGKDVPKFAAVAGKSVEEFSKTLKDKPMEAIIQVSEGLTKGKKGFEDISKAFADAGEDSAKIISTLGVIGGKADYFRGKISDAGEAMKNTNEINEAFELKNQTLGATLDKVGKEFNKLMTSNAVTGFLKDAIDRVYNFLLVIKQVPEWINNNSTAIKFLILGLVLMNTSYIASSYAIAKSTAAQILSSTVTKLSVFWTNAVTASQAAYIVITNYLTTSIGFATTAQRLWNIAINAGLGPLGMIITAVIGLGMVLESLISKTHSLTSAQKLNDEINKKVSDGTTDQLEKIRLLKDVINDQNGSLENKKKALQALININPEYLDKLTLENIKTKEGKDILDKYVDSLKTKAELEAKSALLTDKLKERNSTYSAIKSSSTSASLMSDDQIEKAITSDKKTPEQIKLLGNAVDAGVDGEIISRLKLLIPQIKILQADLASAAKKNVEDVVGSAAKTAEAALNKAVRTIDVIKKDIAEKDKDEGSISTHKNHDKWKKEKQKLVDELEAITGKESGKKGESEFERLKKQYEQFVKELHKLKEKVLVDEQSLDQKEILATQQKFDDLQERSLKYFKANILTEKEHNQQEKEIKEMFHREMGVLFNKQFEKRSENDYEQSLAFSEKYYEDQKRIAAESYAKELIDKKAYEQKVHSIEVESASTKIVIAKDYSASSTKAAKDLTKLTADEEKKRTGNLVEETDKRIEKTKEEELAKANLLVLIARKGSEARLKAEKDYLQLKFEQETKFLDKSSNVYKDKQEKLNQDLKELDKQYTLAKIDSIMQYVGYFQSALNSLNTIVTNKENAELAHDKAVNEKKKKQYGDQLTNKLISKNRHDLKVQQADEEVDKKEKEIKRKQAERDKAISLFNAIVSNAEAIVKTMTSVAYPWNIPLAIAQGIAGSLQIEAISSAPIPELGQGDWVRSGDKHSAASGGINTRIERDEAVINASTMTDSSIYTVTGTAAQITSALNANKGGRSWSQGASMQILKPTPGINSSMPIIMSMGGIPYAQQTSTGTNTVVNNGNNGGDIEKLHAVMTQLVIAHAEQKKEMENWATELHVKYTPSDTKERRKIDTLYDVAQKQSSFK